MLYSGLTFHEGSAGNRNELEKVLEAYREIWPKFALSQVHGLEYKPWVEFIENLEAANCLASLIGYDRKGEIKMFYIGCLTQHLASSDTVVCSGLLFWIAPEYRKKKLTLRKFMKELESYMTAKGVDIYNISLPYTPKLEKAYKNLESQGFVPGDLTYNRQIKR
jgi:hypothetical protein